jgi:hypothetical protein
MTVVCDDYLNFIYQDIKANQIHADKKNISETYGEILFSGVNQLLSSVNLTERDVFFDLGSGLGKLVLQVFMLSPAREVCGIELIPELHQQANLMADRTKRELPWFYTNGRQLRLMQGSFLSVSFSGATVVLISSPCFSPDLLCQLASIIDQTPTIHTVLTMRPLPMLERFVFKRAIRIHCSWDVALCYQLVAKQ